APRTTASIRSGCGPAWRCGARAMRGRRPRRESRRPRASAATNPASIAAGLASAGRRSRRPQSTAAAASSARADLDGRVNTPRHMPTESPTPPIAVVRVITRLNIGGPSIQATRLSVLDRDGFRTTLIHGRLGEGEGDMSYLVEPGARAIYVDTLCRPLSPLNDIRAGWTILREMRRARPQIVHTHM